LISLNDERKVKSSLCTGLVKQKCIWLKRLVWQSISQCAVRY